MTLLEEVLKKKCDFEYIHCIVPNHIIVGEEFYNKLQLEMIDRMIHIKDTTKGTLEEVIFAMKIVKTKDIEGFMVCYDD